ncbi:EamA/RhaT family transporter [Spongiactinospora gelatinilytica]|uniref:EamA/RhaT family transporter n=1 Tax=Spongiactinospora gelatinilytica TaxID=2666298 RepID=A0A2W2HRM7_9ACTN|nr:DMT family transporter [Spongiactinospora gelatinilytica]PZG53260.1 EamA/RhaT family transporter [Spongiactinospora gelatinilytica]
MTAVVLATACALVYGTADFFGGLATRRSRLLAVVVLSQFSGLVFVAAVLSAMPGSPSVEALLWGMVAGVSGTTGLLLFYRALAAGTMSVVAPTTATTSAAVPVLFGLVSGERPALTALAGVVLALAAVLLVSRAPKGAAASAPTGPLLSALAAGAGFGGFFILVAQAPHDAGLWPLAGARTVSIALVVVLALITRRTVRPGPGALPIIAVSGVLDMLANMLYLLAAQRGLLSLVAVLVSLYPATTILLARFVLRERLRRLQMGGVVMALAAVALIATG